MHVALIADTAWLAEELATFRYLAVGLMDEQIRVAQIVPAGIEEQDLNPFGDLLTWRDSRWRWLRRRRLPRQSTSMHDMGVDVIHALDGRLWEGALHLAERLNATLVLTGASASDVDVLRRLVPRLDRTRVAIAAGTVPLRDLMRRLAADRAAVHLVRPGVHVATSNAASNRDHDVLCAVISGTGRFDADYECLFDALRLIIADEPDAQFFLDGMTTDPHPLWHAAQRFGLLANMSLVPAAPGRYGKLGGTLGGTVRGPLRASLKGTDVLIQPQALHRTRGLTLQAMAYGVPVLARADPWLDYLVDGQTAWVVEGNDPQIWYRMIRRIVDNRDSGRRLGAQARQWVRERHLASQQVAATIEIYNQLTTDALKFPQGQIS